MLMPVCSWMPSTLVDCGCMFRRVFTAFFGLPPVGRESQVVFRLRGVADVLGHLCQTLVAGVPVPLMCV